MRNIGKVGIFVQVLMEINCSSSFPVLHEAGNVGIFVLF